MKVKEYDIVESMEVGVDVFFQAEDGIRDIGVTGVQTCALPICDGDGGPELLLQHRARWSHHGGTWGTPGGALHSGESPDVGALREVGEELGLTPDDLVLGAQSVDDHGGWAYTTVLARPARPFEAADLRLDGESDGVAWVPMRRLAEIELHPGLAASLGRLRPLDRKSTRLNSSHANISYAVFCLKKKKYTLPVAREKV